MDWAMIRSADGTKFDLLLQHEIKARLNTNMKGPQIKQYNAI